MSIRLVLLCSLGIFAVSCAKPLPAKVESGFDMAKNSMSFANFASGFESATMNAELMQKMFGMAVCKTQSSPCELTLAATAFMNKANKAMLGGRCEGFAVLASMMHSGKINAVDFGGDTARDLTLEDNEKLQREIAYWFATQLHPSVTEKTKGYMAKDVMAVLAESLAKDAKERVRIGIVKKVGDRVSGGHALTPISYYPGESEGIYIVRVYDNNVPDTVREMRIDTKKNRWEYEASENPTKKSSLYFGDDSNKNPLYFAPIFTRSGELACHFCSGNKTQVTSSGGVQLVVNGTGVSDGEVKTSGNGQVTPSFSATNDEDGTSWNIIVDNGTMLEVSMANGDDGTSSDSSNGSIDIAGSNFTATLSGLNITGEDKWNVAGDGKTQNFINASNNPITLAQQVDLNGKVIGVMAKIDGISHSVTTEIKDDGKIQLEAKGASGSTVTVEVTVKTADGMTKSGTLTYVSNGDSTLNTDSKELEMSGSVSGTVNNNGMMQTVGNACEDGMLSGMESDIDCGGTCSVKCATGLNCNAGGDCESTFCAATSKKCVATSCEDQSKTGDESDVDCGGSCATKCAANKACVTSIDCTAGLACDANLCKPSFVLSAVVTGLRVGGSVTLTNATNTDSVTITSNDTVAFPARIVGMYNVSLTAQPANGTCVVMNGSGTATANVSVSVVCTPTYSIGGNVSGLNIGNSVVLRNNSGDDLTVSADGAFVFTTRTSGTYAVSVQTQPMMQNCTVMNGAGTATDDVLTVTITCGVAGFTIGGSVSGLPSSASLTLQNNGGNNLVVNANGAFFFSMPATGYNVTIFTQPSNASCTMMNGLGTATMAVMNIQVNCVAFGSLDLSYGTAGNFYEQRTGSQEAFKGLVNPDNSTVWVGRHRAGAVTSEDWYVSKITPSGAFDPSFGTSGLYFMNVGFSPAIKQARAIHRLATGSYLVAGTTRPLANPSREFGLIRLTPAGALDMTFGTMGFVNLDSAADADDQLADMAVRADGSIILIGTAGTGINSQIVMMGLTATGALDPAFGTGGKVTYGSVGVDDTAKAVAVNPTTGNIFVVGHAGANALILSFTSSGQPNMAFGTAAVINSDLSGMGTTDSLNTILLQGDGPVVGGFANNGTDNDMLVAVYDATGTISSGFGTAGIVRLSRGGDDRVNRIISGPMGGFYIAGSTGTLMSLGRLQSNGMAFMNFGVMGFFESNFGVAEAGANEVLIDNNGQLMLGGHISTASFSNADFGVARINP